MRTLVSDSKTEHSIFSGKMWSRFVAILYVSPTAKFGMLPGVAHVYYDYNSDVCVLCGIGNRSMIGVHSLGDNGRIS